MARKKDKSPKPVVSTLGGFAWIMVAWTAIVLFFYLKSNPLQLQIAFSSPGSPFGIGPVLPPSILKFYAKTWFFNLTIPLGIWALGHWALRPVKINFRSLLEQIIFEFGAGFGVTGVLMLIIGGLQLYRPVVFWAFYGLSTGLAFFRLYQTLTNREVMDRWKAEWAELRAASFENGILVLVWIVVVALALLMSLVPEYFYDPLVYHIGIPHWYLSEGGLFKVPNLHANFPFLWQMINLYSLGLTGSEATAKFFHVFSGILISLAFVTLLRRFHAPGAGWFGALLLLAMPMTQLTTWTTGNDVAVAFFIFLSTYAFIGFAQAGDDFSEAQKWMALSGVLAGLGFSAKYTCGFHMPGLVLGAGFVAYQRKSLKTFISFCLWFGGMALLMYLPWLIKSVAYTGNPVYPFLRSLFGGEGSHPIRLENALTRANQGYNPKSWIEWVILPWILTMEGTTSLSLPGPLWLALIPLIFAVPKSIRTEPFWGALLIYVAVEWIILMPGVRLLRYHLPQLTTLFFLIALGFVWFMKRAPTFARIFLYFAVLLGLFSEVTTALGMMNYAYRAWPVILGKEPRDISRRYTRPGLNPAPSDAMTQWVATNRPDAHLLILGDEKIYGITNTFYASGVFDFNLLAQLGDESNTPEELRDKLMERGFTHILFNLNEARRLDSYLGISEWNKNNIGVISAFWEKYIRLDHAIEQPEVIQPNSRIYLFLYEITKDPIRPEEISQNPILPLFNKHLTQTEEKSPEEMTTIYRDLAKKWPQLRVFQFATQQ